MPPVIVPLDGSERAETAIPYARALAAGAPLKFVTTRWGNDAVAPREYLEARVAEMTDLEAGISVIQDREPVDAILLVGRHEPDAIICMATHGRSGLGEAVLGSVAEAVVRGAENPVLLVGPHAASDPSSKSAVIVAVDDPSTAAAISPTAAALASMLGLGTCALEVIAPAPLPYDPELDTPVWLGEGAGAEAAIAALTSFGLSAESKIMRDADPAHAIVRCANELPASFVVVGTHARQGLARVALGSVAMRVVHRAPCPVLVVRS